jgi:uncharacterized membrane protein YbhN (UPF0104 family)
MIRRRTTSRILQFALALALTAGLGWFIWLQLDLDVLIALLRDVDPWLLSSIIGVYLLYQLARAWRLRILLAMSGESFPALASTVLVQGAIAVVLPLWLGEVAIILLLRHRHAVTLASGTASTLMARGSDFLIHIVLFAVVLIVYRAVIPEQVLRYAVPFGLLLLVPLLAFSILLALGGRGAPEVGQGRMKLALSQASAATRAMTGRGVLVPFAVLTLLMAALLFVFFHFIMLALGMRGGPGETWFVYSMLSPISSIPLRGIADIGTHEAAWYFLLRLLDVPSKLAAAVAVGSHVLILAAVAATFLIGLAGLSLASRAGKVPS